MSKNVYDVRTQEVYNFLLDNVNCTSDGMDEILKVCSQIDKDSPATAKIRLYEICKAKHLGVVIEVVNEGELVNTIVILYSDVNALPNTNMTNEIAHAFYEKHKMKKGKEYKQVVIASFNKEDMFDYLDIIHQDKIHGWRTLVQDAINTNKRYLKK